MADPASLGLTRRLDVKQLLTDAQHRWLRPAEICEILRNYQKFDIQAEAPNRPPSGSLFLFDRKVLRYFRKDGHNWRKKKDGKTVKEAHEKLKVGSIDVLHCYYAHGEENENFQRRSYWMLEQELMHIVFVHYLDVKGTRTGNSPINSFSNNHTREQSGNADSTSPTSTLSSGCEEIDSADSYQTNSIYQPYGRSTKNNISIEGGNNGLWRFTEAQTSTSGVGMLSRARADGNNAPISESHSLGLGTDKKYQYNMAFGSHVSPETGGKMNMNKADQRGMYFNAHSNPQYDNITNWQGQSEKGILQQLEGLGDDSFGLDLDCNWNSRLVPNESNDFDSFYNSTDQDNLQIGMDEFLMQIGGADANLLPVSSAEMPLGEGSGKYSSLLKQSLLHGDEALKKVDSFSRWVSKELGDVSDLNMRPSSSIPWSAVDSVVEYSSLSPSISQDQLFSISDYSPKWSYSNYETEVHIIGTFLKTQQETAKCNWSCMFGEVEVAATVIADGILCCHCPSLPVSTVPFYVTISNRLACSEVREFDYRTGPSTKPNIMDTHINLNELELHFRLEKLLSIRSSTQSESWLEDAAEKRHRIIKILSLKEEGESYLIPNSTAAKSLATIEEKKQFLEEQIRECFFSWLIHKVAESGNGPCVLDGEGQSVLHLTSAVGYDWAVPPILTAGVSINFRDVNGWTALHWAAFCGREETVALLVALGATTGAVTDPSEECRFGRTPADLASLNGHKGISGFLAESSLTNVLKDLTVNEPDGLVGGGRVVDYGAGHDEVSMKDSLSAVRNATQAASRIYQVYRMQSFQRKKLVESDDEFGLSDERVLELLATKGLKTGNSDGVAYAAAVHIQKKYRGWKKRREFLTIRQRIVKLQAHVRGHQVRKQYKPIIWSVGILEKVILRWRRKGTGLRGFRRDPSPQEEEEDSYDVLQEGRKQNEQRMQHALSRVKSMLHYPEGRAQYTRLLTVVDNFRESQEEAADFESLLDNDSFMSIAFQ